jgi:hypothetical protein
MSVPPFPPSPAPAPAPAVPRKKSGNGCVIALAIVGGLGLLAVVGIGVAVYAFAHSKEGKAVLGTIGDMTQIMSEAQNAPGTKEVRALGCDQAMAVDFEKMERMLADRFDAGSSKSAFSMMVICQVGMFDKSPPTCDAVARAYLGAAPEPARGFTVTVQRGNNSRQAVCSTLYDPTGARVKDLAPGSTPTLGGK